MLPSIVFPIHDPDLQMFPHLEAILPDLKTLFGRAYVCPPLNTRKNAVLMDWLSRDDFFIVFPLDRQMQIGEHFAYLYLAAAQAAQPDEVLHLAFIDRLAFALQGPYREAFMADINSITCADSALIFQRSAQAWRTHPRNYYEIEHFVTVMGEMLFKKTLDYAWCHLVVKAACLAETMPCVRNADLSMVAEMILELQSNIGTRDVDWLAWEDPFLLERDPEDLKRERENSLQETQKRLTYTIPMVQSMLKYAQKQNHPN
jgi:hypothetical protein